MSSTPDLLAATLSSTPPPDAIELGAIDSDALDTAIGGVTQTGNKPWKFEDPWTPEWRKRSWTDPPKTWGDPTAPPTVPAPRLPPSDHRV